MNNDEFNDLLRQTGEIINHAVESEEFEALNQTIRETLNEAIESGGEAFRKVMVSYGKTKTFHTDAKTSAREWRAKNTDGIEHVRGTVEKKQETGLTLYKQGNSDKVAGILMTVGGGILTGSMGIGLLVTSLVQSVSNGGLLGGLLSAGAVVMAAGTAAGAALLCGGIRKIGAYNRFKKYVGALGDKTYIDFTSLARVARKPVKAVRKDVSKMIDQGWFLEGHVDQAETCLITSNETYRQYQDSQAQLAERTAAEQKAKREELEREKEVLLQNSRLEPRVRTALAKGEEFLQQIRRYNDAIPGEVISGKISRIETLVYRIFERLKEHPEVVSDLQKMMEYYLPMTVKLLGAYADMDSQPVQGENIRTAKKEIEDTLDTLNIAFEKLLDSIFQDTAWDVSTDISVLQTLLAQEGLTKGDFEEMKMTL